MPLRRWMRVREAMQPARGLGNPSVSIMLGNRPALCSMRPENGGCYVEM